MTRADRLHAVACSIVRAVHHGRWHEKRVEAEARTNALVRELAEAALSVADETREPDEAICKTCGASYDPTTGRECSCEP